MKVLLVTSLTLRQHKNVNVTLLGRKGDGYIFSTEGDWREIYELFHQQKRIDEAIAFQLTKGVCTHLLRDYLSEMKSGILGYTTREIMITGQTAKAEVVCVDTTRYYIICSNGHVEQIT